MPEIPLFGIIANLHQVTPGVVAMSMYEGFFARFYATTVSYQRADMDWFREHGGSTSSDLLDLCGGSGRLARGLVDGDGVGVVVDEAPDMLAQAPLDVGSKLEFRHEDVFRLSLGKTFPRVLCGGLAVPMFEAGDRLRLFTVMAEHVSDGGRVLFDYLPLGQDEHLITHYAAIPVLDGSPGFVLTGVQRDPKERLQRTNLLAELDHAGSHTVRLATGHELALIDPDELSAELASAGMEIDEEEDYFPPTQNAALSWPLRFVSARKIT